MRATGCTRRRVQSTGWTAGSTMVVGTRAHGAAGIGTVMDASDATTRSDGTSGAAARIRGNTRQYAAGTPASRANWRYSMTKPGGTMEASRQMRSCHAAGNSPCVPGSSDTVSPGLTRPSPRARASMPRSDRCGSRHVSRFLRRRLAHACDAEAHAGRAGARSGRRCRRVAKRRSHSARVQ